MPILSRILAMSAILAAAMAIWPIGSASAQGSGCINVTQPPYNAVGNGTTDNAGAVGSALASLPGRGGCLYFPAGKYRFSSSLSKTLGAGIASIGIYGDGADLSILYWSSPTSGLTINYTSPGNSAHIRDVSFTTAGAGAGVGVTLNQSSCLSAFAQSDIHRVTFRGENNTGDIGSNYWSTAYLVRGVSGTSVDTVTVYGVGNAGVGGQYIGIPEAECYSIYHNISKSTYNSLATGVVYGSYAQGITISQSNFQNGVTGVLVPPNSTGLLSQLNIDNSQFAQSGNNISIGSNVGQVALSGNDIFATGQNSGIFLAKQEGCTIVGNSVAATTLGTGNGIVLGANSSGQPCTVTANTLIGLNVGVWLQAGSRNVNVQSNGYISNNSNVLNQAGTANVIGGGSP